MNEDRALLGPTSKKYLDQFHADHFGVAQNPEAAGMPETLPWGMGPELKDPVYERMVDVAFDPRCVKFYTDRIPEQGHLPGWKPIGWTGGPVQIHDDRFVWWYRVWLWIKFKVFRRPIGWYYARYKVFPKPLPDDQYGDMTIIYRPKHMKNSKPIKSMDKTRSMIFLQFVLTAIAVLVMILFLILCGWPVITYHLLMGHK